VGFPYPLPVLVLDRYGNVAEEWEGDVPVTMTGAARVAGRAPEIFRVVGGRATLPVLTTIAETCTFTLGEEAIIDVDAVTANTNLQQHPMATTIHFIAADVHHLVLSVATVEPDSSQHDVAVMGKGPAPSVGAAVNDISVDGEVSSRPLTPTSVTAGHDVLVSVKALDAYSNLVPQQEVSVFLEAELKPIYDENLTNANLSQQAKDPAQKYLLTLSNGEALQRVPTRVAGELTLRLVQASDPSIDASATRRLKVKAANAVSIDVVNMPEAGRAGVEFQLMVRALDQYGNVDETFAREVQLDSDGAPPGMVIEKGGVVQMVRGLARTSCMLQNEPTGGGVPGGPQLTRGPAPGA